MDKNNFYVYRYIRLDTNTPFYVGKGKNKRAKEMYKHNQWCRRIANKHGFEIEYIFEDLTEEQAHAKEKEFIKFYRDAGYELTNLTDGGEGCSGRTMSKENREKLRIANTGRVASEESKAKMSAAQMGEKNHNFGKPKSEEIRKKISIANTGKTQTEETKAKLSAINKGKTISEENLRKLIEANTGRIPSEETKTKISIANTGKIRTEEFKLFLSIINTGKKKSAETRAKLSAMRKGKPINTGRKVIDIVTKEIWRTIQEAAIKNNLSETTIHRYLNDLSKNKTNLRFLEDYETVLNVQP